MRRVGAVAVVAAGLVLVAGCGTEDGKAGGKPSARPTHRATVEPTEATADPTQDPYPDTPAGDLDRKADEKGWEVDSLYPAASDYVADICESMPMQKKLGSDPGEWLMTAQTPDGDEESVLRAGMPTLCPKWWPTTKKALSGNFVHTYSDGTYEVKASPKDFAKEIAPGTYRVKGDLDGCYWERSTRSGDIIANNFASAAREITVTIASSDGLFKAERCGTWKPVG